MKIRKLKLKITNRLIDNWRRPWTRTHWAHEDLAHWIRDSLDVAGYTLVARMQAEDDIQRVESTKEEFVCQKRTSGEVVAVFDTIDDAQALVLKHVKQKKAQLVILNSLTGELCLHSEAVA